MKRTVAKTAWLLLGLGLAAAVHKSDAAAASESPGSIRSLLDEANFAEAEVLANEYVVEMERAHGGSSLDYARALDLLVEALQGNGKAIEDRTETLAFEALHVKESLVTRGDGELVPSLTNLGRLYIDRGEPGTAQPYLEQALEVGEEAYGPDHPSLILTLRILGNTLTALGELEDAEIAYGREGALIVEHRGPEHLDFAANAYNTAWLLVNLGDFAEAERLFDRARRIVEQAHGPDSPRMVWVLSGLGTVLDLQGDHTLAIATHEHALEIAKAALGPEHPLVGSCETALGAALMHLGDFDEAHDALLRSLALTERAYGSNHENTGRTLRSLAEVAFDLGDLVAAEAYLERAREIFEEAGAYFLQLDSQVLAAQNLAERGEHAPAINGLQSALHAGVEVIPDHPDLVIWEVALGDVQLDAGRNQEAAFTYLSATKRAERQGGADYPAYLNGLAGLAAARARAGETESALRLAARSEELSMVRSRFLAASLPERQALRVAEERPSSISLLMTLAAADGKVGTAEEAWKAVIRARAAVLDELAFRRRLSSTSDVDVEARAEYTTASQRLANLLVNGVSRGDPELSSQLIASARRRREVAEKRLAVASAQFRRIATEREIGFDRVMASLPDSSALVAFVLYQHDSAATWPLPEGQRVGVAAEEPRYAALIAAGPEKVPRLIPLGAASEIDRAVFNWQRAIYEGLVRTEGVSMASYRSASQPLRQLVWDPVATQLGAAERIFVVPDGRLHLVNLAALPLGDSDFLVDRFSFHYLSSERDLVPNPSDVEGEGLLALGGADYQDTTQFAALKEPRTQMARTASAELGGNEQDSTLRSGLAACPEFRTVVFPPLRGAGEEARAIASRWNEVSESAWGSALLLSGGDANETRFKTDAPGNRILHVATHGFFLDGQCATMDVGQRGIGGLSKAEDRLPKAELMRTQQSPLQLSGLVLAGANHRASALPDEEDGILTAEEISALDLIGVEWAVLSGCDTGVGEIRIGEGVFGLRRAFRVAGVQTLIMSLWPVRDDATAEWMGALYEARLEGEVDTITAVTKASRAVLKRRRQDHTNTHPAFWAAFMASGEWR